MKVNLLRNVAIIIDNYIYYSDDYNEMLKYCTNNYNFMVEQGKWENFLESVFFFFNLREKKVNNKINFVKKQDVN